jgi:uncharacterized membrane protein YraQ (UPF0718 family)
MTAEPTSASSPAAARRAGEYSAALVLGALTLAIVFRGFLAPIVDAPEVKTWFTIFVAIWVQATPFLVLGVVVSGAIAAYVPPTLLPRLLPKRQSLAVPVAGLAGVALPGCECGSVPIAGRLVAQGAPAAAALAFLLAAPAINPVVIVSTVVAFPNQPEMALARFAASLVTAIVVGLIWIRIGRDEWVERARRRVVVGGSRWQTFVATATHDFLHAGLYLIVGGFAAATLQVVVPRSVLDTVAGTPFIEIAAMAFLAVILSICSEADAFVAAGLTQFSPTSRLVFLVVGPMVDIKLVALQSGVFGRSFALRFAPLTLVAAVGVSLAVGWWLL